MTSESLPAAAQGVLVVESGGGERTYALGPRTLLDGEVPMLDWRTAPLAGAFFRHVPGERYELEVGNRIVDGTVRDRYVLARGGRVSEEPRPAPKRIPQPDRSQLVVLDAEQQRAVDLPADTSLVVDGEAGVGKTLVALYRIASLARRAEGKRRFRALALVPTEGLRRLVRLLAERLGIEQQLEVAVVDDWLVARAREAFPGLPKRTSEAAQAQVIALKRHPAVRAALGDFDDWHIPHELRELDEKLPRSRARLLHLWGDQQRLERIIAASSRHPGGDLPARAAGIVMRHTRQQFETSGDKNYAHVDADRRATLDGRSLDAGTSAENAHTFDAEDAPVLFELVRRGALPPPKTKLVAYDHIVIDEAQLRAPLELAAIADALAPHGTLTLAGDHRQATDETAWFAGWAAARAEVPAARWAEVTLAVTYRSVPAIGDFGAAISDGTARLPSDPPADPAFWATPCIGALGQAAALCWQLDALLTRDPWRQIAVIARTPEHARRLHAELARGLDPVLVLDGDFRFEPGIVVTTAAAVSGLEFDGVVLPDCTPAFYPATSPELARALYVAATRARDWLWLLTPDQWSPLVSPPQIG